ncbi:MAG: hypothetical protein AAGD88_15205 [Bacteroidota bacterium]
MLYKSFFTLFIVFVLVGHSQNNTNRYLGQHYGDHPTWAYFVETEKSISSDTLSYKKTIFNRNQIKDHDRPYISQTIKILLSPEKARLIIDSTNLWNGQRQLAYRELDDSINFKQWKGGKLMSSQTLKKPEGPFFSTLECLELYFSYTKVLDNLELNSYFPPIGEDTVFRPFKVKVLGRLPIASLKADSLFAYDIAVFSLDGSNVGDAKLLIEPTGNRTVNREYIVIEESKKTEGYKSIGYESWIPYDYRINLDSLDKPSAMNYIEAAYDLLNNDGSEGEALQMLDKAILQELSYNTVIAKVNLYRDLNKTEQIEGFVLKLDLDNMLVWDVYLIGRRLISMNQYNAADHLFTESENQYPTSPYPKMGLARLFSVGKEFEKAISKLTQCLLLDIDENTRTRIKENIEKLKRGEQI